MTDGLSIEHVREAAERLAGRVWRTPVLRCPALEALAGRALFLKAENLQKIGAFKARGAMHAVLRLPEATRARGIVTYSSGNHAQADAHRQHTHGDGVLAARQQLRGDVAAQAVGAQPVRGRRRRELAGDVDVGRRIRAPRQRQQRRADEQGHQHGAGGEAGVAQRAAHAASPAVARRRRGSTTA